MSSLKNEMSPTCKSCFYFSIFYWYGFCSHGLWLSWLNILWPVHYSSINLDHQLYSPFGQVTLKMHSGFNFPTAEFLCITALIIHKFIFNNFSFLVLQSTRIRLTTGYFSELQEKSILKVIAVLKIQVFTNLKKIVHTECKPIGKHLFGHWLSSREKRQNVSL